MSVRPSGKRKALHEPSRRRDRVGGGVRLGLFLAGVLASTAIALSSAGATTAARATGSSGLELSLGEPGIVEQDLAEQRARRERRRAWRRSAAGVDELQRSRTRYRGLSHDRAVALAHARFPRLFSRADRRLLPLRDDQEVHRYTGERTAVVTSRTRGGASLIDSGLPLRARDETGVLRPIDLDLERIGGGWKPANGSVPLRFNDTASEALSFPGDFGVGLSGSRATGARTSNEIFFTDVYTDTDAWFGPIATGGRLAFQLRSEDAPEELRLTLRDAPGVVARLQGGGAAGGVDLFRDGERIGAMSAPVTFDADHESIPVDIRVEGRDVIVRVPHRGRNALYPIAVDPVFENQDSWKYGNGNFVGWGYYESVPQFTHGEYHSCCGSGLWVARNANQWFHNMWMGELHYGAFNDFSYIHRADFMHVRHISPREDTVTNLAMNSVHRDASYSTTFQHYHNFAYPFDATGSYYSVCADGQATAAGCDEDVNIEDSRGNYVLSRIQAKPLDWSFAPEPAMIYWGGARIWLSDWEPPALSYFEAPPIGWVDDVPAGLYNGPNEAHVRYDDRGLGMWDIWMDVPGKTRQYSTDRRNCNGARSARCPARRAHNFSYEGISEGIQTVTATAEDVLGKRRSDARTLRIDRSTPDLTLSGPLKDRENQELAPGRYDLRVDARDGVQNGAGADRRSGVRDLRIHVDDVPVYVEGQLCDTDSCPMLRTWTFDTSEHAGGSHVVEVTAADQLGHERTERFTVRTPCCTRPPGAWGTAGVLDETAFADVDGDHLDDAVVRNSATGEVRVGISTGSGFQPFVRWLERWDQAVSFAVADMTGDGRADLVGRNPALGDVYVAPSSGVSFGAVRQRWGAWGAARDVHFADLDGDHIVDIAGRDRTTNEVWTAYSTGGGFETEEVQRTWAGAYDLHLADVNADGAADLVGRHVHDGTVRVALAAEYTFEDSQQWGTSRVERDLYVADMNGDENADLVEHEPSAGKVWVAASDQERFGAFADWRATVPLPDDLRLAEVHGDAQFDVVRVSRQSGVLTVTPTSTTAPPIFETEQLTPAPAGLYYTDAEDGEPAAQIAAPVPGERHPGTCRPAMPIAFQDEDWLANAGIHPPADVDRVYERVSEAGTCLLRMNIGWGVAERQVNGQRTFDFSRWTDAVTRARGKKYKVYLTLTGSDNAGIECPRDAQGLPYFPNSRGCVKNTGDNPSPSEFADFVRAAVDHFQQPANGGVKTYAIWNEPNIDGFLRVPGGFIPARRYGQLYAAAYQAVANRGVRLLIGELASKGRPAAGRLGPDTRKSKSTRQGITSVRFLEEAVKEAAGTAGSVTAHGVAWHPYQHSVSPNESDDQRLGDIRESDAHFGIGRLEVILRRIRDLSDGTTKSGGKRLLAPGSKVPPLYLTEFGYHNRKPSLKSGNRVWHREAVRASWLRRALRVASRVSSRHLNAGPKYMLIYQAVETFPVGCNYMQELCPWQDYGLMSDGRDGTPVGTVTGDRLYGKGPAPPFKHIGFRQKRAAYCALRTWAVDGDYLPRNPSHSCRR